MIPVHSPHLVVVMITLASRDGGDGFVLLGTAAIVIGAMVTLVLVVPSFLIALATMKSLNVDTVQRSQSG